MFAHLISGLFVLVFSDRVDQGTADEFTEPNISRRSFFASIASIAFLPVLSTPTFLLLAFTFASPCLVQAVRNVCVQLQKNIWAGCVISCLCQIPCYASGGLNTCYKCLNTSWGIGYFNEIYNRYEYKMAISGCWLNIRYTYLNTSWGYFKGIYMCTKLAIVCRFVNDTS